MKFDNAKADRMTAINKRMSKNIFYFNRNSLLEKILFQDMRGISLFLDQMTSKLFKILLGVILMNYYWGKKNKKIKVLKIEVVSKPVTIYIQRLSSQHSCLTVDHSVKCI